MTSAEAPYDALIPPLPESKTVLSSWELVVRCLLIAPGATRFTGWYDNRLVVLGSRYTALYMRAQTHICWRIKGIYRCQSTTCLLGTGITYVWMYEYISIVTYHVPYFNTWYLVPSAFVVVVVVEKNIQKSRKQGTKQSKEIVVKASVVTKLPVSGPKPSRGPCHFYMPSSSCSRG